MASKKLISYIQKNAHLGYSTEQIRTELLREGYTKDEIEEGINVCYKRNSHFSVLRFPLLLLVIGMPVVLLLFLTAGKNLFLSEAWYFVIFASYPAAIAIFLGYKCAVDNIPETQSLKYELLVGAVAGIISIVFTALFLKPQPFELYYLAVIILIICCFATIFITLLTRYILREHITPGVEKPLLNYKNKFNLENFFVNNGDIRMALFIAGLLFLGFYFGSILKAVVFIVLLIAAFTLIGYCYESRNEILAIAAMLSLFGFIGIYSLPFLLLLSVSLLWAVLYYLKTHKKHNFFALFGTYLVAFTYFISFLALAFLFFTYIIAPLLRPISVFYLALIFFIFVAIIVCPVSVYLLYSLLYRTTSKIAYTAATWPITAIVRPHRHKFSDAIRLGFSTGVVFLIISLVVISMFGGAYAADSYEDMFGQKTEFRKSLEIDLQNLLLGPEYKYRLPSDYPIPEMLLQLKQKSDLQKQNLMTFTIKSPESFFEALKFFISGKVFEDRLKFLEYELKAKAEYENSKELLDIAVRELLMQRANKNDNVLFEDKTANVEDHIKEMQFRTEQLLQKIQPAMGKKMPEQTLTPEAIKELMTSEDSPFLKNWQKLTDQARIGQLFGRSILVSQNVGEHYSNANLIREYQKMKTANLEEEAIRLRILLYIMGKEYAGQCLPEDNECFNILPHFAIDLEVCGNTLSEHCEIAFLSVLPDFYAKCDEKKTIQSAIEKC
ncbi:hypothetical protein GF371_01085 [Candidatus Woesearchaeota archaeon]|nr:hypothetical protein [Candidatus Woesearchaeota archaeon]